MLSFLVEALLVFGIFTAHASPLTGFKSFCEKLLATKGTVLAMEESAQDVIRRLELIPLPGEGGFYREIYRSPEITTSFLGTRAASTSIYYLVTPKSFSALHKLPQAEVFHFYKGDPVDMLLITDSGDHQIITLGSDLSAGHHLQYVVPPNIWQGTKLRGGQGNFALLGTTVSPGFEFQDLQVGSRQALVSLFPNLLALIERYTHGD